MDTLTLEQALAARATLRNALGLAEETFPAEAFIGMVSDEIEAARAAGRDDRAIAALLSQGAGVQVTEADLQQHYAPPEARHRG